MQLTLRNALIVSAALHTAAITPFCSAPLFDRDAKKEMVVDYVILKEPAKVSRAVKDVELKIAETPKVELKPKVETAPTPEASPKKAETSKDAVQPAALARIRSTKDYINYYQLLREKIRQNIKRNYRNYYAEGEVHLNFVLSADGSIVSCGTVKALSTSDNKLLDIAVSSLREAAPFPGFPKALSLPTMTFSVTVVFKKE